ncbi:MAG TPA: thiamine phosphate synthase [Abditibacteriaceae bacterium]|jgi:thiamine-phosphate pyrophosphorylase
MKPLPRLMLVTQRTRMKPDFETALEAALRGGAQLIQLREKDLPPDELLALAQGAKELCEKYGATLIINGAPEVAQTLGIGLHLPENTLFPENVDLWGASVHSLESAQRAAGQGTEYLVFGSVFPTQSHPDSVPAGLETLGKVCAAVQIPVFAIGGITCGNARLCLDAGAHGIAVISAVWDAADVEIAVRALKVVTDDE